MGIRVMVGIRVRVGFRFRHKFEKELIFRFSNSGLTSLHTLTTWGLSQSAPN